MGAWGHAPFRLDNEVRMRIPELSDKQNRLTTGFLWLKKRGEKRS